MFYTIDTYEVFMHLALSIVLHVQSGIIILYSKVSKLFKRYYSVELTRIASCN